MPNEDGSPTTEEASYDTLTPSPFQPFEPEATAPPAELPEGLVGGPKRDDEEGEPAPEKPLPTFDVRHREPFEGLLYLGRLQDTFTLLGHTFVIKTLTTEELAEVALLIQKYEATRIRNAIYQTAVVAACVVSVDGRAIAEPLGVNPDLASDLETKFRYVKRGWMPAVREKIFDRLLVLEDTVREVLDEMGNA